MKYKKNKSLIFQKLEGNLVGFDVDKSYLYTFNETAAFIYKKIVIGWDEYKIACALEKKYHVTIVTAKKDVKKIINDFQKKSIIFPLTKK